MKKALNFGTLDSRIYTIFTVMIFITIFIMQLVAFQFTINRIRNSMLESNRAVLDELITQVDNYIANIESLSKVVAEDKEIENYLAATETEVSEEFSSIQQRLLNYINARNDIANIIVVGLNGKIIPGNPSAVINPWTEVEKKRWFIDALEAYDETVVSTSYVQNLVMGQYSWVVSLSKTIISKEDANPLGVLLIDLKFNRIKELCESLVITPKGYNFILDQYGNYIFHPTQQLVYSGLKSEPVSFLLQLLKDADDASYDSRERHLMIGTTKQARWHIVNVLQESDISTDWRYVQLAYTLIGLVLFLVVGLVTSRISSGIVKPVQRLQEIMKSVETGEFKIVGSIKATDEIRELAREYDIMVGRIRELMSANIREQELKRKSDLKALQAQINPHFLYNTLDSIIWMAEMGQSREVVEMTSALSKLFRISISKGKELISISDEIAHVQSYLTIQEMRYQDKFDYDINVDPSLHNETTLKITLQPLVENAIYHGIKETDRKGMIHIRGTRQDGSIVLEVSDNGRGMEAARVEELIASLESPLESWPEIPRHGMGIKNVHERIRIYFGHQYGLTVRSVSGEGTTIQVTIPAGSVEKEL